jgi:hypothetical protein
MLRGVDTIPRAHSTALRSDNRQVVLLKPLSVGGECNSENTASRNSLLSGFNCCRAIWWGRELRSRKPSNPLVRNRLTHLWTVRGGTRNSAAQLAKLGTQRPIPGGLIGPGSPIAIQATIATDFTADGRCRSSQLPSNRTQRTLRAEPSGNLLPFREAERLFGALPNRRTNATGWRNHRKYRRGLPIKSASD